MLVDKNQSAKWKNIRHFLIMSKIWSRWHMYNIFIEFNKKSVKMSKASWHKYWYFQIYRRLQKQSHFEDWLKFLPKLFFSSLRNSSIILIGMFSLIVLLCLHFFKQCVVYDDTYRKTSNKARPLIRPEF